MAKLRVFIAYSHINALYKEALAEALRLAQYEVLADVGIDKFIPDFHKKISANINASDVFLALITAEWLESKECQEEAVRAHERRKRIIAFCEKECVGDRGSKLPHFLQPTLFSTWSRNSFQDDIKPFLTAFENIAVDKWRLECYTRIREVGDILQKTEDSAVWRNKLSQRVLGTTRHLVQGALTADQYSFDVSHEYSYLQLAEPIFSNAKTIIATCIASISTFWTSPDFFPKASNYLSGQLQSAESIRRLFVFDSPSQMNHFKNILQAHFTLYGQQHNVGGVFLCSRDSYSHLLRRWGLDVAAGLNEDFALLKFADNAKHVHARLDKRKFHYTEYDPVDASYRAEFTLIEEFFTKIAGMANGEYDDDTNVYRWSEACWESDSKLIDAMEKVFVSHGERSPVRHHTVFRPRQDDVSFESDLHELAARFSRKKELRIRSIQVGKRVDVSATDGRFQMQLETWRGHDFVLQLDFEDRDALEDYYRSRAHSVEREALYRRLNPAVSSKLDEAKQCMQSDMPRASELFREVEEDLIHSRLILRFDVAGNEPLNILVQSPGIAYGSYSK